jgi:hypothetical protein
MVQLSLILLLLQMYVLLCRGWCWPATALSHWRMTSVSSWV